MWQLSIRSKIIFTLLVAGLSCLAAGAIIGYCAGETALTQSVEERLTAQREIKRRRIESFVNNELRFTVAIGGLPETAEATKALIAAYRAMRAETQADPSAAQANTVSLEAWYNKDLLPRLDKVAGSHTPLEDLMPPTLLAVACRLTTLPVIRTEFASSSGVAAQISLSKPFFPRAKNSVRYWLESDIPCHRM